MRRSLYLLLIISLLSCDQNAEKGPKSKAEYLQKALESDEYKNATMNIKRVKAMLDSVKKGSMDSLAAIFVYNNSIAMENAQVKTVAQVEDGMKKDAAYLKSVQLKTAADLAIADSVKKKR